MQIKWLKADILHTRTHIQMNNNVLPQDGTRSEEQKDAAQVESYVAQRYVENPYLINGNKVNEKYKFYCKSNSEKS